MAERLQVLPFSEVRWAKTLNCHHVKGSTGRKPGSVTMFGDPMAENLYFLFFGGPLSVNLAMLSLGNRISGTKTLIILRPPLGDHLELLPVAGVRWPKT